MTVTDRQFDAVLRGVVAAHWGASFRQTDEPMMRSPDFWRELVMAAVAEPLPPALERAASDAGRAAVLAVLGRRE